uniref:Putative secreted peptide n=1 Tax=Anopheles braziliensis TaxID=58242 RepID=A0A2M3ZU90_9DIPT
MLIVRTLSFSLATVAIGGGGPPFNNVPGSPAPSTANPLTGTNRFAGCSATMGGIGKGACSHGLGTLIAPRTSPVVGPTVGTAGPTRFAQAGVAFGGSTRFHFDSRIRRGSRETR